MQKHLQHSTEDTLFGFRHRNSLYNYLQRIQNNEVCFRCEISINKCFVFYLCPGSIQRKESNKITSCLRNRPAHSPFKYIFSLAGSPWLQCTYLYWTTLQGYFSAPIMRTGRKTCFLTFTNLHDLQSSCSAEITLLSDTSLLFQEHNNDLESKSNSKLV